MSVYFEKNEFEIVLITYNQPDLVKCWLDYAANKIVKRGISLKVYDASCDNLTEDVVKKYQFFFPGIQFKKMDSHKKKDLILMTAILDSESDYIWVVDGSKTYDIEELDVTLFSSIKSKPDVCIIDKFGEKNGRLVGYETLLKEAFISCMFIGYSIYKTSLFSEMRRNWGIDGCYEDNNDFAFKNVDVFLKNYFRYGNIAYIWSIKPIIIKKGLNNKRRSRFYKIWIEDLCKMVDGLDGIDHDKKNVILNDTWKKMGLESFSYGYKGRRYYDLEEKFDEYDSRGLIDRVTKRKIKLKFFAKSPVVVLDIAKTLRFIYRKLKSINNGIKYYFELIFSPMLISYIVNNRSLSSYFLYDGIVYDLFFADYNCGTTNKKRLTERSAELAVAKRWISGHEGYIEIGAVTPYYVNLWQYHDVIDPADNHIAVTIKDSLFNIDFTDKDVLSISTLEHVGTGEYGLSKSSIYNAKDALIKVINECRECLITVPIGYNSLLDYYLINLVKRDYPDLMVGFLVRGKYNNSWKQVDKVDKNMKYGPLYANAICIIQKKMI